MDPSRLGTRDEDDLDALFEQALVCVASGATLDLDRWLEGRAHLRASAEEVLAIARGVSPAEAPRIPHRKPPEIEGFTVLEELGRGGMGVVYRARQQSLGRLVALKILAPALSSSPRSRQRFLNEARALAKLRHPHIVSVHEVLANEDLCAYAMEWIPGTTLAQAIDTGDARWTPRAVARLGAELAQALAAVHQAELVHRDVKPSNVLLRADGTPLLSDFGLVHDEEHALSTRSGEFLGTAAYAAPEQLRGERARVGPRSDLYSLGATLYAALTGSLPFGSTTPSETLRRIEDGRLLPIRKLNPKVPVDLATIVGKAMEPEIERRYASAADLAADLERFLEGLPILARPASVWLRMQRWATRNPWLATAILLLVAGAALSTWFALDAAAQAADALAQKAIAERHETAARLRAEENAQLAREKSALAETEAQAKQRAIESEARASRRLEDARKLYKFQEAQWLDVDVVGTGTFLRHVLLEQASEEQRPALEESLAGISMNAVAREVLVEQVLQRTLDAASWNFHENPEMRWLLIHNIVDRMFALGAIDRALERQAEIYEKALLYWGPDDENATIAKGQRGILLHLNGRHTEAEPFLREAVAEAERHFGANGDLTLKFLSHLGKHLCETRRAEEAAPLLRRVWESRQQQGGDADPMTLKALHDWANALQRLGRAEESEAAHRKFLEQAELVLGEHDQYSIGAMRSLAMLLEARGNAEEARAWTEKAYARDVARSGETHPDVIESGLRRGRDLMRLGRKAEAEATWSATMRAARRMHGEAHTIPMNLRLWLADLRLELKRPREASELLNGHEDAARALWAERRPSLLASFHVLRGSALMQITPPRHAEAEAALQSSAEILGSHPGATAAEHAHLAKMFVALYERWQKHAPDPELERKLGEWRSKLPAAAPPQPAGGK
ncbi:MAG: serine/threonine protein kinase [Planctomycetes bacterium]|nr:serine/threonine protein kinase [Planctomycetota bacterium]